MVDAERLLERVLPMSIVDRENKKVVLPRTGPDEFWQAVAEDFAGNDRRKWRYLAMLVLRETAGWPLEYIARTFKHKPGHITRCLDRIKEELQSTFFSPPAADDAEDDSERD